MFSEPLGHSQPFSTWSSARMQRQGFKVILHIWTINNLYRQNLGLLLLHPGMAATLLCWLDHNAAVIANGVLTSAVCWVEVRCLPPLVLAPRHTQMTSRWGPYTGSPWCCHAPPTPTCRWPSWPRSSATCTSQAQPLDIVHKAPHVHAVFADVVAVRAGRQDFSSHQPPDLKLIDGVVTLLKGFFKIFFINKPNRMRIFQKERENSFFNDAEVKWRKSTWLRSDRKDKFWLKITLNFT